MRSRVSKITGLWRGFPLLLPVLCLAALLALRPLPALAQDQAIVIVVDGVSFVNILLPSNPDMPEHYLEGALREIIQEYGIGGIDDGDLISLAWYPQDPVSTSTEAVRDLVALLARESRRAVEENKKLILIAHSWGTFLANAALGYATNDPVEGGSELDRMGGLDLWLALGSPLGHRQVLFNPTEGLLAYYLDYVKNVLQADLGRVPPPQGIQRIVNYWAWGDIISGPLAGTEWLGPLAVEDHAVDLEMEGYEQLLIRRTSASTVVWHYYDSLMSRGFIDNANLRRTVADLIKETLGRVD
jgi:hypothetical protein